jgi:hypothetical protein
LLFADDVLSDFFGESAFLVSDDFDAASDFDDESDEESDDDPAEPESDEPESDEPESESFFAALTVDDDRLSVL